MNFKKLNGWQRLWVLLSATWLVVIVFGMIGLGILPETGRLSNQLEADKTEAGGFWIQATIETVWQDQTTRPDWPKSFVPDRDTDPAVRASEVEAIRNKYGGIDDGTFVERYQTANPDVNFGQVNAEYEELLDYLQINYQQERRRTVLRGILGMVLLWAVPSVLTYLFAWGVGWVWRGFNLKGESNE